MSDFRTSLSGTSPAPGLKPPLAALWWAAKGQWDKAHNIVMHEETAEAAWVTPICIVSRAIPPMPATGIGGRPNRLRRSA